MGQAVVTGGTIRSVYNVDKSGGTGGNHSSVGGTHAAAVHARTCGNMEAYKGYCPGRRGPGADE